MADNLQPRPLRQNRTSHKRRAYTLSNEAHLRLESINEEGTCIAELLAVCQAMGVVLPATLVDRFAELENQRQELIMIPKLTRLPRSTRLHKHTSVAESMAILRNQRHEFIGFFKFPPEQVTQLSQLIFPAGFSSPEHGLLASEEAMLLLLAFYRNTHANISALGHFLDRDRCNLSRHVAGMTQQLAERYGKLFDIRGLRRHARYVDANNRGLVPSWVAAIQSLHQAKFQTIAMHDYFNGVCLIMDGLRQDMCRCSFGELESATYSGYTKTHCALWGVLLAPHGVVIALIGPFTGRHNDLVFCTPEVQAQVRAIEGKVLCDGIFHHRDWLVPLPSDADKENMHMVSNQVSSMSAMRMPVEWTIGEAQASFPHAFVSRRNKILQSDIAGKLRVSFLLNNLHTILNGNNTSKYFGQHQPFSPEQYLHLLDGVEF